MEPDPEQDLRGFDGFVLDRQDGQEKERKKPDKD